MVQVEVSGPRVTDEQAWHIVDCDPTVYVQPGIGPGVTAADLAADLLDARAERDEYKARAERAEIAQVEANKAYGNPAALLAERDAAIRDAATQRLMRDQADSYYYGATMIRRLTAELREVVEAFERWEQMKQREEDGFAEADPLTRQARATAEWELEQAAWQTLRAYRERSK